MGPTDDFVIGCDVGSQGVKVTLLSLDGEVRAEAHSGYSVHHPRPGWAEQPAQVWSEAVGDAIRKLVVCSQVPGSRVRAIGLDAQLDGVVPVDHDGHPLRAAIIWMDRRAVVQCEAMARLADPESFFHRTGLSLDPSHVAPKIRWIAENEPQVVERAKYFLLPASFVAMHLTGEAWLDPSNASCTMLFEIQSKTWSDELCALFSVDRAQLPPIRETTGVVGGLRRGIAEALGLLPGTPVTVGCGDEHAATLGAGVVRAGQVCDVAGTAEPVCSVSKDCLYDEAHVLETHCHADPGLWLVENPGFVSGANLSWFQGQFGEAPGPGPRAGRSSMAELDRSAAAVEPGAEGLVMLPCLMGATVPTWNPLARGTFFGFTLSHRREHFARAVLEASAYALRDVTDRMRALGLPTQELRMAGGGGRSRLWCQIKADVTGIPACMPEVGECASLGAAIIALVSIGAQGSLAEAAGSLVRVREILEPDADAHRRYDDCYPLYRALYAALEPVFSQAARSEAKLSERREMKNDSAEMLRQPQELRTDSDDGWDEEP